MGDFAAQDRPLNDGDHGTEEGEAEQTTQRRPGECVD